MRQKRGLRLRRIGCRYMIVDTGETVNLADVFTLNRTAARLWEVAEGTNFTAETLASQLQGVYEVAGDTLLEDIRRQLEEWKAFGLIE